VIRVLVVDDDFMVCTVHQRYVERLPGFTVAGTAHTGRRALAKLDEVGADLVLLDIYLPDMSGLEVARALHGPGRPAVDVIAITAARDVPTVRDAISSGVLHYLIKPFTFAAFAEKLERYAAVRRQLSAGGSANQAEVDRLFATLRGSATNPALPKGLSRNTYELVERVLREAREDRSAAEVAELAGLSRVSARRYLEYLVQDGRAELTLRYGAAGRPEHRYRWLGDARH
jgi:two-component system CitB family response regulator